MQREIIPLLEREYLARWQMGTRPGKWKKWEWECDGCFFFAIQIFSEYDSIFRRFFFFCIAASVRDGDASKLGSIAGLALCITICHGEIIKVWTVLTDYYWIII